MPDEYSTIQSAINAASYGDEVLVSAGTYYENIVWPGINGIKLIGSGVDDCIIDGNQQASVIRAEFGVIDSTTLITGFTIQNGNASGNSPLWNGGGMYLWRSSPTLTGVTFSGNTAAGGGGMYLWRSSPTLTDVTFSGNTALWNGGGGMYLEIDCDPTLTGVTFSGNTAAGGGGGMKIVWSSSPTLINSILWGNSPHQLYLVPDITNNINIYYSDIQDGEAGIIDSGDNVSWLEGNINADPFFADPENGDYNLQDDSPCINAGTADTNGDGVDDITDYSGPAPDMGAFEFICESNIYDECGVCDGDGENLNDYGDCECQIVGDVYADCSGECGGDAEVDCAGVCLGDAEVDECGECGGDGSSCPVHLSITNVNINAGTLDIYMENEIEVSGFQFQLFGINITDASDGLAAEYFDLIAWYYYPNDGYSLILATSLTEPGISVLPIGEGLLIQISFTDYGGGEICFGEDTGSAGYNVIADADINYVFTDWGDCYTPSECDVALGDVNGDGDISILDLVQIASYILDLSIPDYECAADYNQDGSVDILDLVAIVNIILFDE